MSSTDLIVLSGWDITIPPSAEQARAKMLEALADADFDGEIPQNAVGQTIVEEMAAAMGQVKLFMTECERFSAELRRPYFEQGKAIKAASDEFMMPLADKLRALGVKLSEFEAEKRRVEIELERQRQAEAARLRREEEERQRAAERERRAQEQAERDRLAEIQRQQLAATNEKLKAECEAAHKAELERQAAEQATRDQQRQAEQQQLATIDNGGLRYEAPKTEGVRVSVGYEFEVTNERELAEWCWKTGRSHWVNRVEFFKRSITEEINSPTAERTIPGLRVYQALGAAVKKARAPRTLTVRSSVEL